MLVKEGKTKEQVQLSEFMAGMAVLFLLCGIIFGVIFQNIFNGEPEGILYTLITSLGLIFVRLLKK